MENHFFRRQSVPSERLPATLKAKWSPLALEEGFVPFPKKLIRCMNRLFPAPNGVEELALVLAVADFKRPVLTRFPSQEYLAFMTGLPLPRILELLKSLGDRGLIRVLPADKGGLDINFAGLLAELESCGRE